jgi:hypothetical protein
LEDVILPNPADHRPHFRNIRCGPGRSCSRIKTPLRSPASYVLIGGYKPGKYGFRIPPRPLLRRPKPKTVAQIEFTEWTEGNHLRHSRFAGLRDDKNPREVVQKKAA